MNEQCRLFHACDRVRSGHLGGDKLEITLHRNLPNSTAVGSPGTVQRYKKWWGPLFLPSGLRKGSLLLPPLQLQPRGFPRGNFSTLQHCWSKDKWSIPFERCTRLRICCFCTVYTCMVRPALVCYQCWT